MTVQSLLIGVDESSASAAAVQHVIDVFGSGEAKPSVTLMRVLELPRPAGLDCGEPSLSWEGAGLPAVPSPVSDLSESTKKRQQAARDRIQPLADMLTGAGWSEDEVSIVIVDGVFTHASIADQLAQEARDRGVDIVVVGRTPRGRFYQALLKSTGQRLIQHLHRISVWIVGVVGDEDDQGDGEE